jgi:hypothetical protein
MPVKSLRKSTQPKFEPIFSSQIPNLRGFDKLKDKIEPVKPKRKAVIVTTRSKL